MNIPQKIISGGQTGVDQGALDFALDRGIECGGWCPPNRECESGRIPDKYPVTEVEINDYNERTRRNILDSDATVIITLGEMMEQGTRLTLGWLAEYDRPGFHLKLKDLSPDRAYLSELRTWLRDLAPEVLNIAGNRESNAPGITNATVKILDLLFPYFCRRT